MADPLATAAIVLDATLLAEWERLPKVPLRSSNLAYAALNRSNNRMFISFKSGSIYYYDKVGESEWQGFIRAPSKGTYFYESIRNFGRDDKYDFGRIA